LGPLWAHLTEACVGLKGSVLATWAKRTKSLRPSRPAQVETLRECSRGKGEKHAPPLHPLAAGPRAWRRGQAGRLASYIREGWGAAPLSLNPSRWPKPYAIVLLIQSISPPYLLDKGRRDIPTPYVCISQRRCHLRRWIGSDREEEMASTTTSSMFC
jgi:hypothetical protein